MNKAIIIGRVGKDAEVKTFGERHLIIFSLATSEKFQKNGETVEETTWHNINHWSKSTKIAEYLVKGALVSLDGSIKHKELDGKWYTTIEAKSVKIEQFVKTDQQTVTTEPQPKYGDAPDTDMPF
jgi:single-strand DNA-binding protein